MQEVSPSLQNTNLILIGFMATGKSTVGRRCAQALGFRFRDSDSLVERWEGKSVAEIFSEEGEAAFRKKETDAIRYLCNSSRTVLSTGGGVVLNPANVACLRRSGVVILLWASVDDILERAGRRPTRPLLANSADPRARIIELLGQREAAYRTAAHAIVETSGMVREEAVECVLNVYRDLLSDNWGESTDPSDVSVEHRTPGE